MLTDEIELNLTDTTSSSGGPPIAPGFNASDIADGSLAESVKVTKKILVFYQTREFLTRNLSLLSLWRPHRTLLTISPTPHTYHGR